MKDERKITMNILKKQNIKNIKIFLEKKVLFYELIGLFFGIIASMLTPFISVCYKKIVDYIIVGNNISKVYNIIFSYIIIQVFVEIIENISILLPLYSSFSLNYVY